MKPRYSQLIELANQYYTMVVVDLDKRLGPYSEQILKSSDVIVAMVPQKIKEIKSIDELIKQRKILRPENTILALGKYMPDTKYNAKNITRSILKRKELINTIPYNNLFFEASQDGKTIDLFLSLVRLKNNDNNHQFIDEIKRLQKNVEEKINNSVKLM